MPKRKTILVAPLHWGLGHATRCIPLIYALLESEFNVIIASDGDALEVLRKEFPELESRELPSYDIRYPKNGAFFSWHLLLKLPAIQKAISAEEAIVSNWVKEGSIDGILSDNRPGVRNEDIPSVYMTHQLQVLSGTATALSTKMHLKIIKKFTECWVPDNASEEGLSGKMGQLQNKSLAIPLRYIGPLSRMRKTETPILYDIICILSGPEPQRSMLEKKICRELSFTNKRILLVQGLPSSGKQSFSVDGITVVPFMNSLELERAINASTMVICRSGYTSVMDLAVLKKKVFFIPTPGQFEQEYLAERFEKLGWAPYCSQKNFSAEELDRLTSYTGLAVQAVNSNFKELFGLFEGE